MSAIPLDLLFCGMVASLWTLIGYPVVRLSNRSGASLTALAPLVGFAVFLVLITLLPLRQAIYVPYGVAIVGALTIALDRARRGAFALQPVPSIVWIVSLALILLPKWLGPPEFSVFQGNHWAN